MSTRPSPLPCRWWSYCPPARWWTFSGPGSGASPRRRRRYATSATPLWPPACPRCSSSRTTTGSRCWTPRRHSSPPSLARSRTPKTAGPGHGRPITPATVPAGWTRHQPSEPTPAARQEQTSESRPHSHHHRRGHRRPGDRHGPGQSRARGTVYEARPDGADGGGVMLTLAVNGIDALRAIDADAAAVAAGFPTPQITLRTHTGKRLGVTSTGGVLADGT